MDMHIQTPLRRYRSIWISDVHLGFRGCNAEMLLEFLGSTRCDHLHLVGDIVDIWQMKRRLYWPQLHNDVIRTILGKAKHGTRVTYVPGNHDELLRDYDGMVFGNVHIRERAVHTTADGRRLLILHGDEFDAVVASSRTPAMIGSGLYDMLVRMNMVVNHLRRHLGFPYWSLAAYLKHKVKNAVNYISNFEKAVAWEASRSDVDGVVCGHIHRAEMTQLNGITYCNCGDWVESCSALVEDESGALSIVHWNEERRHGLRELKVAS